MANYWVSAALFRFLLPFILGTTIIFRPSLLSAIYLLLTCYLPFVPVPTEVTMTGHTGVYLKVLVAVSTITTLGQLAFQITLFAMPPYAHFLKDCEFLEFILRHCGFVRLNDISLNDAFTWISPEPIMLITSVAFLVLFKRLVMPPNDASIEESNVSSTTNEAARKEIEAKARKKVIMFFVGVGRYGVLMTLCLAAVLRPSVIGGLYFLVFLSVATWWACNKQLNRGFAVMLCCLAPFVFAHICTLYLYQFQWTQTVLDRNSTYARYFGLTPLRIAHCNDTTNDTDPVDPRAITFDQTEWPSYINPFAIYWLFYLIVLVSKELLQPDLQKKQGPFSRLDSSYKGRLARQMSDKIGKKHLMKSAATRHKWQSATRKVRAQLRKDRIQVITEPDERTPLMRGVSPNWRHSSSKKSALTQDSTGSVIADGDKTEDIPLDEMGTIEETEEGYTLVENVVYILETILQVIIKVSYLGTNIIMMAWSITYISWITFVLLIWANLIWLIPNQRKSMLRSSPFLVIYAWFLLISGYIYSMNLTEEELPSSIQGVNLQEIGFVKVTMLPCNPLLVKVLYTLMFWVTLRQYMQERLIERQTNALADMVAPLQVTVGAATTGVAPPEKKKKVLDVIGIWLKKFATKFWIWVVAITLFLVAITGQRMTGFRIVYMALFLVFIISFQLSFTVWRKMMFVFWLVVIVFSMMVLVMTYTYQFDNFSDYWTQYLHVAKEQQLDIGLEKFETKQLFVRLVTPTFFVIITVVQLHYFHKDFMELSDPKKNNIEEEVINDDYLNESSMQGGSVIERSEKEDYTTSSSYRPELSDFEDITFKEVLQKWLTWLHRVLNLMYLFLEIHMPKVILFFAMLLCVYDKCALYFILVLLIPASLTLGRPVQMFTIYSSSILVSLFLLARMLYQIKYIDPKIWNVTCEATNTTANTTEKVANNMHWLGFDKTDDVDRTVPSLVKWNIIYILIVTLYSVVVIRQYYYRRSRSKPTTRAFFMFPRITRADADKSLGNMLKYLANYSFFRFGIEITFIATIIVISLRMDIYAVFYSLWLIVLYSLKRATLSKVWVSYVLFIAILLPVQYFMAIALPPTLCVEYPWNIDLDDQKKDLFWLRLQEWAFLMNEKNPPNAKKLIGDFVLLLLASRQWVVFRIERRYSGKNYAGGSNESIIHLAEEKDFQNPLPDFITYARSYLDIAKRCIFCSMFYIALAVVFLAGTNRTNLFSVGYLVGAFLFLWEGTDMYLRPIPDIIKKWNWLLGYNVVVICIKVCFQLIGFILIHKLSIDCQYLTIFGIGRLKNTNDAVSNCEDPMQYLGLFWDTCCFALLIMQKRLFQSFNFFHIVNDSKATTILASRGAELIEDMRVRRMNEQVDEEHRILEKIKIKMDRIKANQQKIEAKEKVLHRSESVPAKYKEVKPPLARASSICSSVASQETNDPPGYHTPIEEDNEATTVPSSILQTQTQAPPSPYSAIMTVSLEGYLEPQRISFSSPPNSELNPRGESPDESLVFSPPYNEVPIYAEATSEPSRGPVSRQISLGPPWMQGCLVTPRQSVISYSTRSHFSHHEYSLEHMPRRRYKRRVPKTFKEAIRSGDYYMFDDVDDEELDLLPDDRRDEDETDDMPTMGEFLNATFKTDTYCVLRERRKSMKRRSSLPLARKKSARSTMSAPLSAPLTIEEPTSKSVTIREDPQPTTSKDDGELSDITEPEELSFFQKCIHWLLFTWALIESGMISLTRILNGYSRDFRYVLKKLRHERRTLKEKTEYTTGNRTGFKKLWQPSGSFHDLMRQSTRKASVLTIPEIRILAASLERGLESPFSSKSSVTDEDDGGEMSSDGQPPVARLLLATWYVVMSRSEWLVYFAIFLNQAKRATLLSLPLPLMVFFWGSLTIPRPTKTFWVTIIAYTEVCILIKCLFQLDVIPWNEDTFHSDNPFFAPNVIGIQKRSNYASWDLVLLLAVFFHRMMLKSMGIWKTSTEPVVAGLLVESEYGEVEYRLEDGQLIQVSSSQYGDNPISSSSPEASRNSNVKQISIMSGGDGDRNDVTDPVSVQSVEAHIYDHIPESLKLGAAKYVECFKLFFHQLLDPTARVAADVYTFMFLCDFFNFFVILMGYSSFGSQVGDGGFKAYLEENRVPPMFLFMLILQFMLIIIDRGIYLRRNILGKLLFQFIQTILLHVWLFILFPVITEKEFKSVIPPQIYYIVKCIYFLLSAYQIRCGYPSRILGNCLCKGYSMLNMFLFKGFMLVPFLFELRSVMDWMWTETSMGVFDWLKMEDIFAHIFVLKCSRNMEDEYPQPRGTKKGFLVKYLMGTALLIGIIGIIWFPLVFFSLGKAVGEANPPYDVTLELRIGPYDPVYQMSAQSNTIFPFSDANYQNLLNVFKSSKRAEQILSNYDPGDIAAATFSRDSAKIWSISPPDRAKMISEVNSTKVIKVRLDYKISHKTSSQTDSGIISNNVEIEMEPGTPTKPNLDRINLLKMLQNNMSDPIKLRNIMPKFLKITNTGVLEPYNGILGVSDPETGEPQSPESTYRNISLILLRPNDTEVDKEWWNVKEICGDFDDVNYLKNLAYADCNNTLVIYTLNDKIFPQTLSIITGGGIIGLYTTLVLVASRILRGIFAEQVAKIMFEDLPNVDRVLQLCLDVYLVREAKEFALEEDLFAKLIFLFRSPETMIKWSRPKEELEDDEDPEAS